MPLWIVVVELAVLIVLAFLCYLEMRAIWRR
jgi:hypothetical protein